MPRIRPRFVLPGVLLVAAGLLPAHHGTLTAHAVAARPSPPTAGVVPGDPSLPAPVPAGTATTRPLSLRYTFDGGVDRPITDLNGGHELRPVGRNGGELRLVPQ